MPNLLIPLPNTLDTVSRRVAKSVIDNVIRIARMDVDRVEIRGESQQAAQPGSEIGDTKLFNRFQHDGRVMVTFRETYVESEVLNAEVRHPYAQPIFADPMIGVHIKPIYSNTEMELAFVYRAKSKSEAMVWRDDIKVRMADNRQSHLHEVDYFFAVPDFCSQLLMHIHELRESQAAYGEDLGEYLRRYYTKRAKVLTNQSGNDKVSLLVIAEKQLGVQGWFDFDTPVEEEKQEDGPSYLIQFNYKFSFLKPVELNVLYPQIVHNQLIKPDFIVVKPREEDPMRLPTYKSDYRFALDNFDYLARIPQKPIGGIHIPDYDEWIPKNVTPYTTSLINWMVVFEAKDMHLAFNQEDVLNTGFLPEFIQWMRGEGNKLVKLGQSPVHFCLYRDTEYIADGDLEIVLTDQAFEIRTKTPVDLRQRYHLRMGFCTELGKYSEEALMAMHENGYNTLRLFQTVMNRLDVEHAQLEHMTEDGKLSISFIKRFFGFLHDQRIGSETVSPPPTGNNQNNRWPSDSWYDNDDNFGFRFDIPYVMYLTILAGNRNRVNAHASSNDS
ncbi:hypothetical protein D3C76_112610 [compost metagenome]